MTEQYFQDVRRAMSVANAIRGQITTAKLAVQKWTGMVDFYAERMKPDAVEKAEVNLKKAMTRLQIARKKFADFKLPTQ